MYYGGAQARAPAFIRATPMLLSAVLHRRLWIIESRATIAVTFAIVRVAATVSIE